MCSNSIRYLQDIDMDVSEPAGVVMVLALLVGGPVEVYSRTLKLLGGWTMDMLDQPHPYPLPPPPSCQDLLALK